MSGIGDSLEVMLIVERGSALLAGGSDSYQECLISRRWRFRAEFRVLTLGAGMHVEAHSTSTGLVEGSGFCSSRTSL